MSSTTFLLIAMTLIVYYPVNQAQPAKPKYEWPDECEGKSYCHVKPSYYPQHEIKDLMDKKEGVSLRFGNMEDRVGGLDDVASCEFFNDVLPIYMIKDKYDMIRFVPQTDKFNITISVQECKNPGKVNRAEYLSRQKLNEYEVEVDCVQTMVPFIFPVLSLDYKSLESEAPKDGISLACSGKVITNSRTLL